MRRTALCVLLVVLFITPYAMAHPPTKIEITYDPADKTVTAVITHPVADPATHYIGKVDLSLNEKEVIAQQISRQENENTETVKYRISDAKPGDTIGVEAYCNINGKLEEEIRVQ